MLVVLSPSKTLDFVNPPQTKQFTQPDLLDNTALLAKKMQGMSAKSIAKLMGVSEKIATLNYERYQQFSMPFSPKNAKQAVLAFKGDVYEGLGAEEYGEKDLVFAQQHLRILSGFYGVLRPLDLIQPYRLEMGIKLKNTRGKDLYAFWGDRVTETLNEGLVEQGDNILINLASNEYFKAVRPKLLQGGIITPVFKEKKGNDYKVIGLFAKKARGMMADYIIRKRLKHVEAIKEFSQEGYRFAPKLSKDDQWVFIR